MRRLAAGTEDGFMLFHLCDVVEDGYRKRLWTEQALRHLASDLVFALAITGAAMLVETHGT